VAITAAEVVNARQGMRGLNGANTPSVLYSNSQACKVQSLKSWFASHWSALPTKPEGA
jgi:hypothetical protein